MLGGKDRMTYRGIVHSHQLYGSYTFGTPHCQVTVPAVMPTSGPDKV